MAAWYKSLIWTTNQSSATNDSDLILKLVHAYCGIFLVYSNLHCTFRCHSQGYTFTGELYCHSLAGLVLETYFWETIRKIDESQTEFKSRLFAT